MSNAERDNLILQSLIETENEVRKYKASFLGQLAVALVAAGIIAPALTLVTATKFDGLIIVAMICCWILAALAYFAGEHQLTKGDK